MRKNDEIIILLHDLKNDISSIKKDISEIDVKLTSNENRINKVESIVDKAKGMAIVIVSFVTVGFTLAYEYVKKLLGI